MKLLRRNRLRSFPCLRNNNIVTALRTKSPTPFFNITNILPLWNVRRGVFPTTTSLNIIGRHGMKLGTAIYP